MIRNLNHLDLDMEGSKEHLLILKIVYLQDILVAKGAWKFNQWRNGQVFELVFFGSSC